VEILISSKAQKQLKGLPKEVQDRIKEDFIQLRDGDITSSLGIKKLRGFKNHYRLRVGNYRVRFEVENSDKIKIYWVGKRSKAYDD
jgi:mRNA interferase RelE/StbE